ncbi:unnamed protein product [Ostreobium quekettii]|uniref:COP9 signalosome complex subunit 6 n=1 Tax=Ostreobium quekettii TaxID=121088 RepID=A0A8S1IUD9_9CHLO|nr:unnamed protein product [Ostreobium quekettii]
MASAEEEKQSSSGLEFKLHPLVLINVSEHHTRVKANLEPHVTETPRVLGCLLGVQSGRSVDLSNSFEIPYRQSPEAPVIDWEFMEKRLEQYKDVFPKLELVGWYSTGSELREADMVIHRRVMEKTESPVFLMLNPAVDPTRKDIPVTLYETELHVIDGNPSFIFVRASYTIETSEAERIGVDQVAKILPSGKASGSDQLTAHLVGMHSAIKMLNTRLRVVYSLLEKMSNEMPLDHSLLRKISSLVHQLPVMDASSFQHSFLEVTLPCQAVGRQVIWLSCCLRWS